MIFVSAGLAVLAFILAFRALGVVPAGRGAMGIVREAGKTVGNKSLSDEEKERAVQAAAKRMFGATWSILWRITATLAAPMLLVWLISALGGPGVEEVTLFLLRIDVLIGLTVFGVALSFLSRLMPEKTSDYSALDKALHRVAFATPHVQLAAAGVEDTMFRARIEAVAEKPPVFIASLPRAGTTVVLNAMAEAPGVATHLYRDMPFVMAPMLWAQLSAGFSRDATLKERAHGDGLKIGYDSPEAFEEVIWRAFYRDKFKGDRLPVWTPKDMDDEAQEFFRAHFRKIVALRCNGEGHYVSKNNGNVARLTLLPKMFPGCKMVVPLRDPAEHAASLYRQHENFLKQHAEDPFTRRYMRDIGHLEFGALHRPIDFEGFGDLTKGLTPAQPDYWLAYWIAANRHIATLKDTVHIVTHARLETDGAAEIEAICREIGLDPAGADFASHFKPVKRRADTGQFDSALLEQAKSIYADLAD
ncbi:MAG: sulfotransferase [Rhodobacteraceae bacterium]|nr:sulfotransferase [Paracoccaceae bacterium]